MGFRTGGGFRKAHKVAFSLQGTFPELIAEPMAESST